MESGNSQNPSGNPNWAQEINPDRTIRENFRRPSIQERIQSEIPEFMDCSLLRQFPDLEVSGMSEQTAVFFFVLVNVDFLSDFG